MTHTPLPASIGKVAGRELPINGYDSLEKIAKATEKELLAIHGVGPKAIRLLKEEFRARGIKAVMLG